MKRFTHVSVREDSGVKICRDAFDVQAEHVLDAVFLLRAEDYEKIIAESEQPSRKLGVVHYLLAEYNFRRLSGKYQALQRKEICVCGQLPYIYRH